ncbi:MAG: glutathione S-transferase family protein [Rhodospirillaceae bacterium]|jgi:putative glutathione S-transferase|nr:glutathione S-transferase family protein [Rhodospirillaceae bacterium]MBT3808418.1 glutathione S-transferase family protein [Rhodospirillaceae bacterium]MBT3930509.1 glutathione S-transferase family protein [Rhodospirillaceae bacterium]MBT4770960.1 glutathione S-transferase family protein [Rhodospirillaceae bacterium]MBT5359245.1 glutathione S-transferase family protein [Rhodospirillaceae bacterium]
MGMLLDGTWLDNDATAREVAKDGKFQRSESQFRSWVTADGSAGPTGEAGFAAEPGRYHLYLAHTCPWAHRALIFRTIKGLDSAITVSLAQPGRHEQGWTYGENPDYPDCLPDHVNGFEHLHQAYTASQGDYTGKVTVPTLWDKQTSRVVNNESSEIIRMFNTSFDAFTNAAEDYYPADLRAEIDAINDVIYPTINNGVYRAGFASSQEAYEEAVVAMFETLDDLEKRLGTQRYLVGDRLTEADWRLWVTLIRFDACYVGAFKCNIRRIADYPNLTNYTRELYQIPGIAQTFSFEYAKLNYYGIERVNPNGIVPIGPEDQEGFYGAPHDRGRFPAAG